MPPPKRLVVASINLGQSGSSKCVGCLLAKLVISATTSTSTMSASWHIDCIIKSSNIISNELNTLLHFSNRVVQARDALTIGSHSRLNCIDSAHNTLDTCSKICFLLSGFVQEPQEYCKHNDTCDDVQSNVLSPSSSIIISFHMKYILLSATLHSR